MHVIKIMPHTVLRCTTTGAERSQFSAVSAGENLERIQKGFTLMFDNGTTGGGMRPAPTFREAAAKALDINIAEVSRYHRHAMDYPETAEMCRMKIKAIPFVFSRDI